MLPSEERLRRASVFQRAYNKRMVVSTSVITMYILPKEGKNAGRGNWKPLTGFVVAKKVSKSAVKRNRAKRRIREVYRLLRKSIFSGERQDIALGDWYAIVFVAHEAALEATYQQVEEAVVSCLVRGSSKNRKDRQGGRETGGSGVSKPAQLVSGRTAQSTDGKQADSRGQGTGQGAGQTKDSRGRRAGQGAGQTKDSRGQKPAQAGPGQRGQKPQSGSNRQHDSEPRRPTDPDKSSASQPETKS